MSVSNLATCEAVLGKSGSGKSTIVKRMIKARRPKRLIVWSPDEDLDVYQHVISGKVVRSIPELVQAVRAKTFAIVFWPSMDARKRQAEFDYVCKIVFELGDTMFIVEELKYVTSPTHSPESWAMLTTRGRKKGVFVVGVSQRPAHIDKDFLGNTSAITCLALKYPADRKAVSDASMIPVAMIEALKPLDFIRVGDNEKQSTGTLKF